jgi:uncharacterized protein YjbJ (UPF0337 family)
MGSHTNPGRNKFEEMRGDAKERIGAATGNESMRREGKREQSAASLKQAGKKLMDALRGR